MEVARRNQVHRELRRDRREQQFPREALVDVLPRDLQLVRLQHLHDHLEVLPGRLLLPEQAVPAGVEFVRSVFEDREGQAQAHRLDLVSLPRCSE